MKSFGNFLINSIKIKDQGQSMVEYVLIISLIAIVLILVVTNFGDTLLGLYTDVKDAILDL